MPPTAPLHSSKLKQCQTSRSSLNVHISLHFTCGPLLRMPGISDIPTVDHSVLRFFLGKEIPASLSPDDVSILLSVILSCLDQCISTFSCDSPSECVSFLGTFTFILRTHSLVLFCDPLTMPWGSTGGPIVLVEKHWSRPHTLEHIRPHTRLTQQLTYLHSCLPP